jgi:PIN domain nuclease of toxin-antitoxin system
VKLLLDTHIVFWANVDDPKLSPTARAAILDPANSIHVSIGSAWEMALKSGLGKWPEVDALVANFEQEMLDSSYALVSITLDHVRTAGLMQSAHRDPFDRLLAAQAQIEGMTLVSADPKLHGLGAAILF